jgi:hypothetical protein
MCDSEKLPNLFAEIDQFEAGICFFGGNVEADHGAEAHAVNKFKIRQIQGDAFANREEFVDACVEHVGGSPNEPAMTVDKGLAGFEFNVQSEEVHSGCIRHLIFP